MKYYRYSAKELGLTELPPGELRLAGWEITGNPGEADAFVVPCDFRYLSATQIAALLHLAGNVERHALFMIAEQPRRTLGIPAIIFRSDCNKGVVRGDPTTISWPWPVKDLAEWTPIPEGGFQYDICFVGHNSTSLTGAVCQSVQQTGGLTSFIQINPEFYGSLETRNDPRLAELRQLFLETMQKSRLSLCARSIPEGVVRYRFYEAMSMARIPVHFCDGAYLPFQNKVDWDRCSIHLPEAAAPVAGDLLRTWLDLHSDADIIERGKYGRAMWERWLDGRKWDELFAECVTERLVGRM